MAPISPVKPAVPKTVGQIAATTNVDGSEESSCSQLKVVQIQKSTSSANTQTLAANSSSKSFVVVSSSTNAKSGNTQRVLTLGNVPISGSQPLKIASIPNVLHQSGAKIVSIAKSMPMTTGFKMIAVTTVVPGSTQVKTVYIATPIMSVTKTSIQGSLGNQTTATKLLQTLVSSSTTSVRIAQTDVSPSNSIVSGRPSLGLLNSKSLVPVTTGNIHSFVKASIPISVTSGILRTPISTTSVISDRKDKKDNANQVAKLAFYSNDNEESLLANPQNELKPDDSSPTSIKVCDNEESIFHVTGKNGKTVFDEKKDRFSLIDELKPVQCKSEEGNISSFAAPAKTPENSEETILLAGEKFLADLAAKFSKSKAVVTSTGEETESDIASSIRTLEPYDSNIGNTSAPLKENLNSDTFIKGENSRTHGAVESKVIVHNIVEDYKSPVSPYLVAEKGELPSVLDEKVTTRAFTSSNVDEDSKLTSTKREIYREGKGTIQRPRGQSIFGDVNLESLPIPVKSKVCLGENDMLRVNSSTVSKGKSPQNSFRVNEPFSAQLQKDVSDFQHSADLLVQNQPRNIFSSFFPTNGSASEGPLAHLKQKEDMNSKLNSSPIQLSAENSPRKYKSIASSEPLCSQGVAVENMNHKQTPLNENCARFFCESPGEAGEAALLSYKRDEGILSASTKPLDCKDLPVTNRNANGEQNLFTHTLINTTSVVSMSLLNSTLHTRPVSSPKSGLDAFLSAVSRPNPSKSCSLSPQSDINIVKDEIKQCTLEESYGYPVVLDHLPSNIKHNVPGTNTSGNVSDNKMLKHSPRGLKSNTKSLRTSSHVASSEIASNESTGLELNQELHNRKAHVFLTDIGRGTAKKRKAEASSVLTVGWIKGALT